MIFAIFNLSGNIPGDNDKLISDNNGSEITSIDFLITEIGILSAPGALPSLKLFVIEKSSSRFTGANLSRGDGDFKLKGRLVAELKKRAYGIPRNETKRNETK